MSEITGRHNARIIAIGNQKGGVGKSTLTVHLAAGLGELGRKCLIWDLDMNRGASVQLGVPKEAALLGSYEVLVGEEDAADVVISNGDVDGIEFPDNVSLISARRNLEDIDIVLYSKNKFGNPRDVLRRLVDDLRSEYDYIFLDTAPNLTIPTVAAYKAADYFLLSAIPEPLSVEGLGEALADITTVKQEGGNPSLRLIGVVLSAIKGRTTRLQRELIGYVEEYFDQAPDIAARSYNTRISETTYICESQKLGKTMFQVYPDHKVTKQYAELVRELEFRIHGIETDEKEELVGSRINGEVNNG